MAKRKASIEEIKTGDAGIFAISIYQYFGSEFGQRLYFWDDRKVECGVLLFSPEKPQRYARIQNLIDNLVSDPSLRKLNARDLDFPLNRHDENFGVFPEEKPGRE